MVIEVYTFFMSSAYYKKSKRIVILLIFVSHFFTSCESSTQVLNDYEVSCLRIADYIPISTLNPLLAMHGASVSLLEILYDTLIRIDEDGEVIPHLAKSWEVSNDLKRWRFYLRKNVKFHNGTELMAKDVLYTFKIVNDQGHLFYRSGYAKYIERVRCIDEYCIEFIFSEPLSTFLSFVNMVGIFSVPNKQEEDDFLNPNFQAVGTGPYKFASLDHKQALFNRHDEYFLGRPEIRSLKVKILPDHETIWAKLMREEIDIFDFFGPDNYHFLTQIPAYKTVAKLRPYYCMMIFNCDDSRFKDIRVRRALNLLVNKERIIEKNLEGHGKICSSNVYPSHWAFDGSLQPYSYDPRQAIDLLNEAGWILNSDTNKLEKGSIPFEITLIIHTLEASMPKHARSIERDLEAIGITMITVALSPEEFYERTRKGAFDAAILNLCAGDDPDFNFTFWHSSSENPIIQNYYSNPEVDRLLTAGRRTIDREERKKIYCQFQHVIHDDPPGVFLYWMEYLIAVHERFGNVNVKMVSGGYFRDIPNWTVDQGAKQ